MAPHDLSACARSEQQCRLLQVVCRKKLEKLRAPGVGDVGEVENVLRVGSHHRVSSEGNARDKGQIWLSEGP